jgi:FlaA1/EpsC-like NDP-sugar epimerase
MQVKMLISSLTTRGNCVQHSCHRAVEYLLDWISFAAAGIFAFELRFDGAMPAGYLHPMKIALCVWVVLTAVAFIVAKVDRGNWRFTSAYDAVRIVMATSAASILGGYYLFLQLGAFGIPRSVYLLDWLLSCLLTVGARSTARVVLTRNWSKPAEKPRVRTLIYGAGSAALALLTETRQNQSLPFNIVGLIDDDPSKAHLILQGKRILGSGEDLAAVVRKHGIKKVLIATPSATGPQMVRILKFALEAGVEYKMVPGLGDFFQNIDIGNQLRDVAVEDLLGRKPVSLDQDGIRERIQDKVVMVTGAAGSIGSEICRQVAHFNPRALIGFDEAETPLFQIDRELRKSFPNLMFYAEIGNIIRPDRLRQVMQKYQPAILYHAAAYKHVPMMEKHVFAAIENNIFGTWCVAQAAINYNVEDFVMISTDKAVRPTSMMGATKRVSELVIRALQKESGTKFVAVRFGNVLGSNGSVVPIFKEQIAAGGPVTVTHPEMSRYFMTIPEASQLVLQAFSIGKGGEVFVLDMGEPVKIVDLATNLILLSGLQPNRDIKIQFTGLRPGEKLFEELNLQDECLAATSHPKIKSYVCPSSHSAKEMKTYLNELREISEAQDVGRLLLLLKELIIDYNPGSQLLRAALSDQANRTKSVISQAPGEPGNNTLAANSVQASLMN